MGQVLDKFQGIISVKIWIFRLFVSRVTRGKEKKEHTSNTLFVFIYLLGSRANAGEGE